MKTTNKMDGDAFARELASMTVSPKDNHIVIAQEAVDLKDEAKQSAQSYWMMGWTWDEIESVLEDSEYPANVITYAIKETKEYASKILNEGPFAVLKAGQLVKLLDGSMGRLIDKYSNYITIRTADLDEVIVQADQLDLPATGQLREAHALRLKAENMIYKLSTDQLEYLHIESEEADPVLRSVDDALATIESLRQSTEDVKKEAANLHSKWSEETGKWEPKSEEEKQFAQYMYVTLADEKALDDEVSALFHHNFGGTLARMHEAIRRGAQVTDEGILAFLNTAFPAIAAKLEGHLYGIKQRNAHAREYVQQFLKFDADKDSEWKKNAVQWSISSLNNTREFMDMWENQLAPTLESGIHAIAVFLANVDKTQITASVQKALKTL